MSDENSEGLTKKLRGIVVPQYLKVPISNNRTISMRWLTGKDADGVNALLRSELSPEVFTRRVVEQQAQMNHSEEVSDLTSADIAACAVAFARYPFGLNENIDGEQDTFVGFQRAAIANRERQRQSLTEAAELGRMANRGIIGLDSKAMLSALMPDHSETMRLLFPNPSEQIGKMFAQDEYISSVIGSLGANDLVTSALDRMSAAHMPMDIGSSIGAAAMMAMGGDGRAISLQDAAGGYIGLDTVEELSELASAAMLGFGGSVYHDSLMSSIAGAQTLPHMLDISGEWWREIEESQAKLDAVMDGLSDHDFAYAADYWVVEIMVEASELDPSERDGILTQHSIEQSLSHYVIEGIEKLFAESEGLDSRWKSVESGLEDHLTERYWSSVPLLIAQCEGLINEIIFKGRWGIQSGTNVVRSDTNAWLSSLSKKAEYIAQCNEALLSSALQAFLGGRFYRLRNGVLHGSNTGYGTAKNSADAVLTLAKLASIYSKMPASTTHQA